MGRSGGSVKQTTIDVEESTSENYTLQLGDAGKLKNFTSANAVTVTVPANSSVAFPVGTTIEILSTGAGGISLVAGTGVTVGEVTAAAVGTVEQNYSGSLVKIDEDTWIVAGVLA